MRTLEASLGVRLFKRSTRAVALTEEGRALFDGADAVLGTLANCSWSVVQEGRKGWRLLEHNAGTLPEPVNSDDRPESAPAAT